MKKIALFFVCILTLISCSRINDSKPNIIIILADDAGYSDFGSWAVMKLNSNIDQLALDGVTFNNALSFSFCFSPSEPVYWCQQRLAMSVI